MTPELFGKLDIASLIHGIWSGESDVFKIAMADRDPYASIAEKPFGWWFERGFPCYTIAFGGSMLTVDSGTKNSNRCCIEMVEYILLSFQRPLVGGDVIRYNMQSIQMFHIHFLLPAKLCYFYHFQDAFVYPMMTEANAIAHRIRSCSPSLLIIPFPLFLTNKNDEEEDISGEIMMPSIPACQTVRFTVIPRRCALSYLSSGCGIPIRPH